jgi:hypothetical protein
VINGLTNLPLASAVNPFGTVPEGVVDFCSIKLYLLRILNLSSSVIKFFDLQVLHIKFFIYKYPKNKKREP